MFRYLQRSTTLLCLVAASSVIDRHVAQPPSMYPAADVHHVRSSASRAVVRGTVAVRGRIDSILTLGGRTGFIALVGGAASQARFLPHDDLLVWAARGTRHGRVVRLPRYTIPPALVGTPDGRRVYVVIDSAVWWLTPPNGRVKARWRLDFQALGWPAAAVTDSGGRLYIAGQKWDSTLPTAAVEALAVDRSRLRVLWRSRLGTTHSGIWLSPMEGDRGQTHLLAAFLPNAADAGGTIALLSRHSGALSTAYPVGGPPSTADPLRGLLYLAFGGAIHALSLSHGAPVSSRGGSPPLTLDVPRGIVAFVHGGGVTVASARTLHPLARIPIRGATALAFSSHGSTLLVGHRGGITLVELGRFPPA